MLDSLVFLHQFVRRDHLLCRVDAHQDNRVCFCDQRLNVRVNEIEVALILSEIGLKLLIDALVLNSEVAVPNVAVIRVLCIVTDVEVGSIE